MQDIVCGYCVCLWLLCVFVATVCVCGYCVCLWLLCVFVATVCVCGYCVILLQKKAFSAQNVMVQ